MPEPYAASSGSQLTFTFGNNLRTVLSIFIIFLLIFLFVGIPFALYLVLRFKVCRIVAAATLVAGAIWFYQDWRIHRNPYTGDGLHLKWTFGGASSTVPGLDVWVDYQGNRIDCPVSFGGLDFPELRFRDYDGDGKPDIVFENNKLKQVVSFTPAQNNTPPQFKVLRNDVYWP